MTLFRPEVIAFRNRDRLAGEVLITTPSSFHLVTAFFVVLLGVGGAVAFNADFPHIESLHGAILPDKGMVNVAPSRAGTIAGIEVVEGSAVVTGQLLATIQVGESTLDGASAVDVIAAASAIQRKSLANQILATRSAGEAKRHQLGARSQGIAAEISQLKVQLVFSSELVESAKVDLENAKAIARTGFASKQYVQSRTDMLSERRLSESMLQQTLISKEHELHGVVTAATQTASETQALVASLDAAIAQLDQQAVGIGLSGSYQIRAPVAGIVSHVSVKPGQQVQPQDALMTIVPKGSTLRAELNAATSSIAFIRPGQKVRLALDSFPFQKFGTVEGVVTHIAASGVAKRGAHGEMSLHYPVIVALRAPFFLAGRDVALKPGMTVSARIVTERRTLFEWLLKPYYSVSKRD